MKIKKRLSRKIKGKNIHNESQISGRYDEINRLNEQVSTYYEQARFDEAINAATRLRDLLQEYLGTNDPNYAACLSSLATLYQETRDYDTAEHLHKQALKIRLAALGNNHLDVALTLRNLAEVYVASHRYSTAERYIHEALDIQLSTLGRDDAQYATSLTILGALHFAMGNYLESERFHKEALSIRRSVLGENDPHYAVSLYNLAEIYRARGQYVKTEELLLEASRIYSETLGKNHPDYATAQNSLGTLYISMGNFPVAISHLRQASSLWRSIYGENDSRYALSLNNLADAYHSEGWFSEAESFYRRAIEIDRAALGPHHPDLALSLDNFALLYLEMGDYSKAEPLQREAIDILSKELGENHPTFATCLNNRALLHRIVGDYRAAEQEYEQALQIHSIQQGENHPAVAITLNNLASVYVATDRQTDALKLMNRAGSIEDQTIGQIFSIGSERQRMTYLDHIRRSDQMLMSLVAEQPYGSPIAVGAAYQRVLRRKALVAEALAVQRDAVLSGRYPALRTQLQELFTLRSQIAQATLAGPIYENMDEQNAVLEKWVERRAQLEAQIARVIPEMDLQQQLQHIDCATIVRKLPNNTAFVEFMKVEIFDFKAKAWRQQSKWKPACYLVFVLLPGHPEDIRMINLGEADPIDRLVESIRIAITGETRGREAESKNFTIADPESTANENFVEKTIRKEIVKGIPRQPGRIQRESNPGSFMSCGLSLRQMVFDPIVAVLPGYKRILLAPDGDLNRLPFEILPLDNKRYVIDEYRISYLNVGRDVLRFGIDSGREPQDPIVIGAPNFDLSAGENKGNAAPALFPPLEGTQVESEQVAHLLGVNALTGDDALKGTIKSCRSPQILHIATHGFFRSDPEQDPNEIELIPIVTDTIPIGRWQALGRIDNPLLRSGLALAGANTWLKGGNLPQSAEDGILTAEDVTGLDLLDTEVVVLSACETGLGHVHVGEGVFGLRRVFMLAGAKTIVMSLWKVPDKQTKDMMVYFYHRLMEGISRADALREAQLEIKKQHPHPLYWGAFICQGDPGVLTIYER